MMRRVLGVRKISAWHHPCSPNFVTWRDRRLTPPECLYEAAREVWQLPPLEDVIVYAKGGPIPNLAWDPNGYYCGEIALVYSSRRTRDIPEAVRLWTATSGREIGIYFDPEQLALGEVDRVTRVTIDFGFPPSVVATGELIARLWETYEEGWATVDYYDQDYNNLVTVTEDEYPGPVHPRLGMIRWVADFQRQHPEFVALVPDVELMYETADAGA